MNGPVMKDNIFGSEAKGLTPRHTGKVIPALDRQRGEFNHWDQFSQKSLIYLVVESYSQNASFQGINTATDNPFSIILRSLNSEAELP